MDPRYIKLATVLTQHSIELQHGENVLIDAFEIPNEMVIALIREVRSSGAIPFVTIHHGRIDRELMVAGEKERFERLAEIDLYQMERMHAYIALRGSANIFEQADVASNIMTMSNAMLRPILDRRLNHTKWVVLRWPTASMAQQAGQSTDAFEEFYFRVCTLDYGRMTPGMEALKRKLESTSNVHITGPGSDLRFCIENIPVVTCGGLRNIPDGEVFTCPLRNSVEGEVTYNVPSVYQGHLFERVHFTFSRGKIVEATAQGEDAVLQNILNSDPGARYIGEFSLGFNPHILEPMKDILFDEKIAGSFHLTPGQAYELADNGNRSQIHWDLVCIQRSDYGGGEVYFDGELVRKDGIFVSEDLQMLNSDYLLAGGI